LIYSNLNLDNPFEIKDFSYFIEVGKSYSLDLSHMKEKIHAAYFTLFFHPFHKKPSTFLSLKQACKIVT